MRVQQIEAIKLDIRMREPITISFHTWKVREAIFLRITADNGAVGWGEASPFKPITGDSREEILAELAALRTCDLPEIETPARFYNDFLIRLKSRSLQAAFDFAVHDLVARTKGVPVYRLYSSKPAVIPNCYTVFIKKDGEATRSAAAKVFADFPHLQVLKIKLKGSDDLERCRAIKSIAPRGMRFVLDANQGFSDPQEAVDTLNSVVALLGDVVLVEEPCPKGDLQKLRHVKEHVKNTLIVADESCAVPEDLEKLIAAQAVHGVNIKLLKAGGMVVGKKMAERAREAGLRIMVGSMIEQPLGNVAGTHFAVSTAGVILTDLDMDIDFPDFAEGKLPFLEGRRIPSETAGFGFQHDRKRLEELVHEGIAAVESWILP